MVPFVLACQKSVRCHVVHVAPQLLHPVCCVPVTGLSRVGAGSSALRLLGLMELTWVTGDRERQRDAEARLDAKAATVKARARAVRADEDESFEDDLHLPPWRRADLSTRCTQDP